MHAHYGTNSAMVAMLCRMIGGPPYSFTMHGPEEFDAPAFSGASRKDTSERPLWSRSRSSRGVSFIAGLTMLTGPRYT